MNRTRRKRRTRRAPPYRRPPRPIVLGTAGGLIIVAIRDGDETIYQRSDGRIFGSLADAMSSGRAV